jgi:hypothetical protein
MAVIGVGLLAAGIATYLVDGWGTTDVPPDGLGPRPATAAVDQIRGSVSLGVLSDSVPYRSKGFPPLALVFRQAANSTIVHGSLTGVLFEESSEAQAQFVLILPSSARNIENHSGSGVQIGEAPATTSITMDDYGPFQVTSTAVTITLDSELAKRNPTVTSENGILLVDVHFEIPRGMSRRSRVRGRQVSLAYMPTHPVVTAVRARMLNAENTNPDFGLPTVEVRVTRSTEELAAVVPAPDESTFGMVSWKIGEGLATRRLSALVVNRRWRTAVELLEALTFLGAGVLLGAWASTARKLTTTR